MKKDIHPKWYPDAKVIYDGNVVMTIGSTQPELYVDIWSGSHPFFTGEQRLIDTEGQVDRFMRRLKVRQDIETSTAQRKKKADPRSVEIGIIGLETRSETALEEAGYTTLGDLVNVLQSGGDDGLLAIPGIGQTALIAIKRHLRSEELI